MRRTASYKWLEDSLCAPLHVQRALMAAADTAASAVLGATQAAWDSWHLRAEAALVEAVRHGWAELVRPAERPKGSVPSARPAAGNGSTRAFEPIAVRRWRRLHRAARQQWRQCGDGFLTEAQRRHWSEACRDGLCQGVPGTQAAALEVASTAILEFERALQRAATREWRDKLAVWGPQAARVARPAMRGPEPAGHFSASSMEEDWAVWWCRPPTGDAAAAWRDVATEAEFKPKPCAVQWDPEDLLFRQAVFHTRGSGGLDGWEAAELQALCSGAPLLIDELQALFGATVAAASDPDSCIEQLRIFWWRVVGIPKRNSTAARPIAVGSVALRAWHRALLPVLPALEHPQFGGRPGVSAVHATVDWLAAPSAAGAEIDLEKAFDSVNHDAAAAALVHQGTPTEVVQYLRRGAWAGRRICHVAGELAAGLHPVAGIPPGDPLSPTVLAVLLSPWPDFVKKAAAVDAWLFVDDRSLKVQVGAVDQAGELERALLATRRMDEAIGVRENASKRQLWSGNASCEHLGLRLAGATTADAVPELRDGWEPVRASLARLAAVKAPLAIKEKLAACFISSQWLWAAPLLPIPPAALTQEFATAILQTNCTWWCRARFFADRIALHPGLGTAVRCCQASEGVGAWRAPLARQLVATHAAELQLEVVRFDGTGLWVSPAVGASPQVVAAAEAAGLEALQHAVRSGHEAPPRPSGRPVFRPALPAGGHAARVAARVVCLRWVRATRHDAEGLADADVSLLSHSKWKKFLSGLSREDAQALAVWRGGAVFTPTRRWIHRNADLACCPWCPEPSASARHLWASCPRMAARRRQLEVEHRIAPGWWGLQTRAVSKSGWVPVGASVHEMIAANALGIAVAHLAGEMRAQWQPSL
mmetsp:Transcript_79638/g.258085  ORF Transcript_79638/g.258085 Transcript_79638/m.258085 type:complete len:878 (-) Transcript_79638:151-2784(-)